MLTMIGHAMEATGEGGFLFAGPLCEACGRPVSRDAVIRCHRREHRPAWRLPAVETPAVETRVRLVFLCADCGDDPLWRDWLRVSVERETILGLMGQIGLCAFMEAEAR